MKRKKLLFAVLCIASALGMRAQAWEDVTSTYMNNADFETGTPVTVGICTYSRDMSANSTSYFGMQAVDNWTAGTPSDNIASGSETSMCKRASGLFTINSGVWLGSSANVVPTTNANGEASGQVLGIIAVWGGNATYTQTSKAELPVGTYMLVMDVYNCKGDKFLDNSGNFIGVTFGGNNYYSTADSYANSWTKNVVKFNVTSKGTVTFSLGTQKSGGSSDAPALFIDNVKLYYADSDVTADKTSNITNPNATTGDLTGWTVSGNHTGDAKVNGGNGFDGEAYFFEPSSWGQNSWYCTLSQTITDLPTGFYKIQVAGQFESGVTAYLTANNTRSSKFPANGTSNGTIASDGSVVAAGSGVAGWNYRDVITYVGTDGTLTIGAYSTASSQKKWANFDNFTLTLLGDELKVFKNQLASLKSSIDDLLDDSSYENVVGTELTTLTAAKSTTAASETVEAYETAISSVQSAIDAFTAAKTNYDALVAEIAKAKALGIDDATADGYAATSLTTAATALTNTQDLKVAEYGYVNDNYEYGVDLGVWTTEGYTADNSGQHWDGTNSSKYKEQENSWGTPKKGYAADSWSIKFYQSIELPAGNYVFKVAGRKASGTHTTMSLDVTKTSDDTSLGSINDFPEGDTGLGINKSGATSFDPEDAAGFANSGAGRGWEWRYVKFTLPSTTEVKIAVNADADATSQWMSFCNYTLQTDDDKNISLIAYNVALSSAETIIADDRYENVTGSEKTVLQDAIDDDEDLDKDDKDAIDAATTALEDAKNAFVNAKDAYDAFVAAQAVEYEDNLPYASSTKFAAIATAQGADDATSASDATTKTNAIISAYRKYVESNAMGEGVSAENKTNLISDPNMNVTYDSENHTFGAWQVFSQTDGTISLKTKEDQPLTDGDGNNYKYADIWKTDNNGGIKQTLTDLPAGKYLLTAAARAQNAAGATFGLFAGDARTEIPKMNNEGGVFGNGWNDVSLEFFVTETSDVEIGVLSGNGKTMWWGATRFRLVRLGDASESVTVTPAGYATYASDYPLDFTSSGIKAYIATTKGDGTGVDFTQINKVPAGTGVLLYKDGGTTDNIPIFDGTDADGVTGNVFVRGTGANVATDDGTNYNYILNNKLESGIGFYKANGQKVATNRAYISILQSESAGVKEFFSLPGFEDNETAIENVNANVNDNNAVIYNVAGQRISKMQKGINIVNGKKILK